MSLRGKLSMFKHPTAQPSSTGSPEVGPESSSRPKFTSRRSFRSMLTAYPSDVPLTPQTSLSEYKSQFDQDVRPSKLVAAFVDSLTASQLSDFLVWFLYYDVVELPESPAIWYKAINSMEMRGWIALGQFLSKTTKHGLDSVVLDSICDPLRFSKTLIRDFLVRLAEPTTMSSTLLSTIIQKASRIEHTEIDVLENVVFELNEVRILLSSLTPTAPSVFLAWQPKIAKQLKDFVEVVISCRLATLRKQPRVPTGLTAEQERRLKYAFEAMQEERYVPLIRYGFVPDHPNQSKLWIPSDSLDGEPPAVDDDVLDQQQEAECLCTPQQLRSELRVARAQNMELSKENSSLIKVNEQLAKKVLSLSVTSKENSSLIKVNEQLAKKILSLNSKTTNPDELKIVDVLSETGSTAIPDGAATPAPVRRVLSNSSHHTPTSPNMFTRVTAFAETESNVIGRRRSNSDPTLFFSRPPVPSLGRNDSFQHVNDKSSPLRSMDSTSINTFEFPRKVRSNDEKQKVSDILREGDNVVWNNGIVELQTAAVLESHETGIIVQKSSRSLSDGSKKTSRYGSDGSKKTSRYGSDGSKKTSRFGSDGSKKTSRSGSGGSKMTSRSGSDGNKMTSRYGSESSKRISCSGSDGSKISRYGSDASKKTSRSGSGGSKMDVTSIQLGQNANVLQYHNPPTAFKETISRPASEYSKKSKITPVQPGPHNSLAEYRARQIGEVSPLCTTTVKRRTTTLGTMRNAILSVERRPFGNRHLTPASKTMPQGRRRSRSVGDPIDDRGVRDAVDEFLRKGWAVPDEEQEKGMTPDISKNF
jgi:hypothetical protein